MNEKHILFIQIYTELLPEIRDIAKQHGYAIAVHGSLRRDFDLIAVPWVDDAADPAMLLSGILQGLKLNKIWIEQCYATKELNPYGRVSYAIPLGADMYIDLSIMEFNRI